MILSTFNKYFHDIDVCTKYAIIYVLSGTGARLIKALVLTDKWI